MDSDQIRHANRGHDDGFRPTVGSRFRDWIHQRFDSGQSKQLATDPEYAPLPDQTFKRWQTSTLLVPPETTITESVTTSWLWSLASCHRLAFELVGCDGKVTVNISTPVEDSRLVAGSIATHFPKVAVNPESHLKQSLLDHEEQFQLIELGLIRESLCSLASTPLSPDPLTGILLALAQASKGELALVQILFSPVGRQFNEALMLLDGPKGKSTKVDEPLFAVSIRLGASGKTEERSNELLIRLLTSLAVYSTPHSNGFIPLSFNEHTVLEDVSNRVSRRSGMLLSFNELISLVHLPNSGVHLPSLVRHQRRSHPAPPGLLDSGVALGINRHAGIAQKVSLPDQSRLSHLHVVGASGTGKSTLLVGMILDDIKQGHGIACIDPHGDLVDEILARISKERQDDVILFDPVSESHVVGWNMLGAESELEKRLLESDLVSIIKRLSTSFGDQMEAVLGNAIGALLESPKTTTIIDLRRFLVDSAFRQSMLSGVRDEHIRQYWTVEYPLIEKKNPHSAILQRLDTLLRSKVVRESVSERDAPINFRAMMDSGKIFLARLSLGAIGETSASLLGSLLVSKLHQTALSRQDVSQERRRPFFVYVDEFHHVATPSMATIFSGTRKYGLGMTISHQGLFQIHKSLPEVERSILDNAFTRIVFRVSDEDARKLERGFGHFSAPDLMELATGQAVVRFGERGNDFNLETTLLPKLDRVEADQRRSQIRELSFKRYGRERRQQPQRRVVEPEPTPKVVEQPPIKEKPATEPTPREAPKPSPLPGRGGPEHRYLQQLVKNHAENLGFKAEIEHHLDSGGWVDVALERGEMKIAIEVATSSSARQELEHITEALEARFTSVIVVTRKKRLLSNLNRELKRLSLSDKAFAFSPEEALAYLDGQMPENKEDETIAGYTVNVTYSKGDPASDARRKQAVAMILANRLGK